MVGNDAVITRRNRAALFESSMPGKQTRILFDEARRLAVGFYLGCVELASYGGHYNTSILVNKPEGIIGKYRETHLPGHI